MHASTQQLEVHQSLASSNDVLIARARAGAPDGTAILALSQTSGRGTQGRAWTAPAGNLSLSVLIRTQVLAGWSLLAGVALHETIAAMMPDPSRLRLKWPNDLMIAEAKLGGILIEAEPGWLVAGFGVNLAHAPAIVGRATIALADVAAAAKPEPTARALLARLSHWRAILDAQGIAPVRAAWLRAGPLPGTALRVRRGGAILSGDFEGLAEDGGLMLRTEAGRQIIHTGEILAGAA